MAQGLALDDVANVSGDHAYETVIELQARLKAAKREVEALRKDREQLLDEYNDRIRARDVPHSPITARKKTTADTVRVCIGDLHGMRQDASCVSAFLADLAVLDPDEIVLGGDMLECGGWLAKHQPIGFVAQTDYSYQEDVEATSWFLDQLQVAAPHAVIHYLIGNHEDRVERWCVDQTMAHKRDGEFLLAAFSPVSLLRLDERGIKYYERTQVYADGCPRGWMKLGRMHFTHQLGKSQNAARDSAMRTAGNVTYFHTHREDAATLVFPTVGMVKAFCPGCACVMQPVWKHSDPSGWSQGYGIDYVAKSGNFQRVHVPIWRGESLAGSMIERFKS